MAYQPEEWPGLFTQHLNAGDLEAVLALYAPEARFVALSGEMLVGRDQIGEVLAGLIRAKARFRSRVLQAVCVGDVALLYTDFNATTVGTSGNEVEVHQKAIEVLRRQEDGTWKLIMGDPNGRQSDRAHAGSSREGFQDEP